MLLFTRFLQLISLVPTDASIFQRLGEMYDKDKDKSQSFQYYCEVRMEAMQNTTNKRHAHHYGFPHSLSDTVQPILM